MMRCLRQAQISQQRCRQKHILSMVRHKLPLVVERPAVRTASTSTTNTLSPSNVSPASVIPPPDLKSSFLQQQTISNTQSWSSPNDRVSQNKFTRDHQHLWTLLEACMDSNNMVRADAILQSLDEVADPRDLVLAVNHYLEKLVEQHPNDYKALEQYLNTSKRKLKNFKPNGISEAIILKGYVNAYYDSDNSETGGQMLQTRVKELGPRIGNILRHSSILGSKRISTIVKECKLQIDQLPVGVQEVVSRRASDMASLDPIDLDKSAQTHVLKPGVESLENIDTLGFKTIRHTLQGLKIEDIESLQPFLEAKDVDSGNYIDFLALYDQLRQTSEEKAAEFERALERMNLKRQQAIESKGYEGAREKWQILFEKRASIAANSKTDGDKKSTKKLSRPVESRGLDTYMWEWNEALVPLIDAEFERIDKIEPYSKSISIPMDIRKELSTSNDANVTLGDRLEYGPYLKLVAPSSLAPIVILELIKLCMGGGATAEGVRTARAVLSVGKTVEMEYRMQQKRAREKLHKAAAEGDSGASTNSSLKSMADEGFSWPISVRAKIGSLLISLFLSVARVPVKGTDPVTGQTVRGQAPAFYHSYQYQGGNKIGLLKAHHQVSKHLSGESFSAAIQPQLLPMLVKPEPWTAWNHGGYLYTASKLMRSKGSPEQMAYLKAASERGDLDRVYKGLNVLGETAWTINKDVFSVVHKVWNTGKEFLEIPKLVDLSPELPPAPPRDCDPVERRDWLRKCRMVVNENQSLYSQRCDINYKLEIARALLGERFYFPHNLDFRGRAYPLSPHLNHLGNDLSRGLLMFWKPRKLGERGLYWLKVHLANLCGHSKLSFDDRIQFVDKNMSLIHDSADKPLDGELWWQKAEDPWQALACCKEITAAIRSGNLESFESRLPVHMDGSCNGLQHYAALGGDVDGATQVNLVPSTQPQDVYSRVLDIVRINVGKDVMDGGNKEAELTQPLLSRKIVKQTVMTNVYGVTFVGARQQIANRLKDANLQPEYVYKCAAYLAHKTLGAVRELFEGAHLIQDWLGDCAARISRSVRLDVQSTSRTSSRKQAKPVFMSSVIWTTPLGLPIVQPYRQETKKQILTSLQSIFISDPYSLRGVDGRKQRSAFPPNYIHSLDATHMLLSAIGCGEAKIEFAAVHDSYWTHAADIDTMNTVLRSQFIALHQEDLISQLRQEFEARYTGLLQYAEIPRNCDLAENILKVERTIAKDRFGSERRLTIEEQLLLEQERFEIETGSADPSGNSETEQESRSLVTPVSLVRDISQDVLDKLCKEASKSRKAKAKSALPTYRSTEHVGTGPDTFREQEELETVQDQEDQPTPESPTLTDKKQAKVLPILTPLHIAAIPPKGEFDVQQVAQSPYFFS